MKVQQRIPGQVSLLSGDQTGAAAMTSRKRKRCKVKQPTKGNFTAYHLQYKATNVQIFPVLPGLAGQ